MSYKQLTEKDNTIEINKGETFRFACCDCGLTHDFKLEWHKDKLTVILTKNNNSTSQLRRHNDYIMD